MGESRGRGKSWLTPGAGGNPLCPHVGRGAVKGLIQPLVRIKREQLIEHSMAWTGFNPAFWEESNWVQLCC